MRRTRAPYTTWLPALIVLGLSLGPVAGAEEARQKDDQKDKSDKPIVITDEDLLERYGKPEPAPSRASERTPANPKAAKQGDRPLTPLELMEQQKAQAADKQQRVHTAEQELAAAKATLANLEKQLLATTNPYAARPELSEEERKVRQESQETANDRHQRTKLEVTKARQKVEEAQQKLADARAGKVSASEGDASQ